MRKTHKSGYYHRQLERKSCHHFRLPRLSRNLRCSFAHDIQRVQCIARGRRRGRFSAPLRPITLGARRTLDRMILPGRVVHSNVNIITHIRLEMSSECHIIVRSTSQQAAEFDNKIVPNLEWTSRKGGYCSKQTCELEPERDRAKMAFREIAKSPPPLYIEARMRPGFLPLQHYWSTY